MMGLYRVIAGICGRIRAALYMLIFPVRFGLNSSIGKYSVIRVENGNLICKGRFCAREFFRATIDNADVIIEGPIFLNYGVSINSKVGVKIGKRCKFGEGVKIYDHDHEFGLNPIAHENKFVCSPVIIGDDVWLGSDVIVLKGVEIGNNVVVGAGSVVTKNIPSNTVMLDKSPKLSRVINR